MFKSQWTIMYLSKKEKKKKKETRTNALSCFKLSLQTVDHSLKHKAVQVKYKFKVQKCLGLYIQLTCVSSFAS